MDDKYDCSTGISNRKEIEKMKDVFTLMIDNLNKTITNLGLNMEKKFDELNNKIDKVDTKIDTMNINLPEKVNTIVDAKMKTGVFSVVKWLVISISGVAVATVVGKILVEFLL